MHTVAHETSLLVKAAGVMAGEVIFGMYGPLLFVHSLSWFEVNLPGAAAIGVLVGAGVGYGVGAGALRLLRRERTSGREERRVVIGPDLRANVRA